MILKYFRLFSFFMLCCLTAAFAQTSPPKLFYEKVYLHTDRDTYATGEDLWFKAYLVDAQNNLPINYSNNLHVELISPEQQVISHNLIRLSNGKGHGDIKLPDTLQPGNYRLRAYTNWMRNFGQTFIFEKTITIVSSIKPAELSKTKKTSAQKTGVTKPAESSVVVRTDTVRFFPEGGSLIEGVSSVVAVKAENSGGNPVRGTIISAGVAVATFQCDSAGMGVFTLLPVAGKTYKAVATINGKVQDFKLQGILSNGYALSISSTNKELSMAIKCNSKSLAQALNQRFIIKVKHGGKECFNQPVQITSGSTVINAPLYNFPEGVTCITLYNDQGKPLSERLYYITDPAILPDLRVSTDKTTYAAHEQAAIKIKLGAGEQANLSVAVVDAIVPFEQQHIVSYLNLSSEIKGPIEYAARYFDPNNQNRLAQLDMLLLTQGWREYIWKTLEEKPPVIVYKPEQGITLTGQVRKTWRDKPLADMNITMFANNATGQKLFTARTDSAGRFTIPGVELYGYQYINFTSRTNKGKNGGWIKIDSLVYDQLAITPSKLVNVTSNKENGVVDTLMRRELSKRNFSLRGVNQLEAVTVKGYSAVLPSEEYSITMNEQKEYDNLAQYLLQKIPGARTDIMGGCRDEILLVPVIYRIGEKGAIIRVPVSGMYADGSPAGVSYCGNNPLMLSMDKILKVTLLKRNSINGVSYSVSLVLRPGVFDVKNYFANAVADVNGYYKARTFYTPRYNDTNTLSDLRTTLHWQPNVITNANGEATINIQNTNAAKTVRIVVQGMTDSGVPVAATTSYVIK